MPASSWTLEHPGFVALCWVKGDDPQEENDAFQGPLEWWEKQANALCPLGVARLKEDNKEHIEITLQMLVEEKQHHKRKLI